MDIAKLTEILRKASENTVYKPNPATATPEEIETWEFLEALADFVDGRAQSLINWSKD